jgi:hypothetical protein
VQIFCYGWYLRLDPNDRFDGKYKVLIFPHPGSHVKRGTTRINLDTFRKGALRKSITKSIEELDKKINLTEKHLAKVA